MIARASLLAVLLTIGCAGGDAEEESSAPVDDAAVDSAVATDTGSSAEDSGTAGDTAVVDSGAPDAPASDTAPPPGADSLLVYTLNIENMIFDWNDIVHVMAAAKRNPDVVLVQQMTSKKRLDELTAFMSATLGEKYEGVVAQDNPTHNRFQDEVKPNPTVTTGVVWRAKRFNLVRDEKWFPWGTSDGSGGHTCAERARHSGYQTIRVVLDDTFAKKRVAATSLRHWTWMDCSEKNMIEMVDGRSSGAPSAMPDVAMQIVGGDFNGPAFDSSDNYKCWYRVTNHALDASCAGHPSLGFADPLYEQCMGNKTCVSNASGIDFIFARKTGGKPARTSNYRVIPYDEGDAADKAATGSDQLSNKVGTVGFNDVNSNYSEHRARRAILYYD